MTARFSAFALTATAIVSLAAPAAAQLGQSDSYKFLTAIRDAKGEDVEKLLNRPGTTIVNTRDQNTGEGALHIVVKRGDETYLRFLISRGADVNIRDGQGNTPLIVAANAGQPGLVDILIDAKADVNLGNSSGETPIIRAVQRRDMTMVHTLLVAGADPDRADVMAGMSARDYAHADKRSPGIAKLIDDTPKKPKRAVSGPKL